MISVKKIITRKLYEIKINLEHTFSNISVCDNVCSSLVDAEEHHTEHREILFLSWYYFAHTLDIFMLAFLSFFVGGIWTSWWFFSFPSSLPGGSFFGARFGGVGVGVLLKPCDSSDDDDDDDDDDDMASDVCLDFLRYLTWNLGMICGN